MCVCVWGGGGGGGGGECRVLLYICSLADTISMIVVPKITSL